MALDVDKDALKFIYNRVKDSISPGMSFISTFLGIDGMIKELKFDIFAIDGTFTTSVMYNDKLGVKIEQSHDLDHHIDLLKNTLNIVQFCFVCDSMTTIDKIYKDKCIECTFMKSFIQQSTEICSICQELIHNDWYKTKCCNNYFHKQCRIKAGKWAPCPLCRSEDVGY